MKERTLRNTSPFFEVVIPGPRVSFRNPETVSTYLVHHPEIEIFIKAAWPALVEYFGNPVEIVLELMYVPDEAAHEELVGWIQSTDEVNEGLRKFGQFEDGWLLDHLDEMKDHFSFNIETRASEVSYSSFS